MSNCPICRRSMLKFNLKKYGMCFTCYMKNKMSENNCGGTAKGNGNSELGNNSEESHITTSSQESSPQKEVNKRIDELCNELCFSGGAKSYLKHVLKEIIKLQLEKRGKE